MGTALDGYHALRRVVEVDPDIVLIDSHLEGIGVLDLVRQVRAMARHPRVVLITAETGLQPDTRALTADVDALVTMGCLVDQLPFLIQRLFPKFGH